MIYEHCMCLIGTGSVEFQFSSRFGVLGLLWGGLRIKRSYTCAWGQPKGGTASPGLGTFGVDETTFGHDQSVRGPSAGELALAQSVRGPSAGVAGVAWQGVAACGLAVVRGGLAVVRGESVRGRPRAHWLTSWAGRGANHSVRVRPRGPRLMIVSLWRWRVVFWQSETSKCPNRRRAWARHDHAAVPDVTDARQPLQGPRGHGQSLGHLQTNCSKLRLEANS